jgi:hypothetical protein
MVYWGQRSLRDPTPLAEVERRVAAAETDVVVAYLDEASERRVVSDDVIRVLRDDLERRSCSEVASQPPPPLARTPQPPPPPPRVAPGPAVVAPIWVEPGSLARWWGQAREAVRTDLALHGLAYLGVLLMFAGVADP